MARRDTVAALRLGQLCFCRNLHELRVYTYVRSPFPNHGLPADSGCSRSGAGGTCAGMDSSPNDRHPGPWSLPHTYRWRRDVKDLHPPSEIVFDPAYVERVTAEIVKVIGEAQAMIAAGKIGPDLVDVARHAQELHEILNEQLMESPPSIVAKFGPVSAAMGQGIAQLRAAAELANRPEGGTQH